MSTDFPERGIWKTISQKTAANEQDSTLETLNIIRQKLFYITKNNRTRYQTFIKRRFFDDSDEIEIRPLYYVLEYLEVFALNWE